MCRWTEPAGRPLEAEEIAAPQHLPCLACAGAVSKLCEYFFHFPFCNPFKKTHAQPKQGTSVGSMFPAANRIFRSPGLLCPPRDFCWVGVGQAWGMQDSSNTLCPCGIFWSLAVGGCSRGWEEGSCAVSVIEPRIFWL